MKHTTGLTLALGLLINCAGCCSIIHSGNYSTPSNRGKFRPACYLFGNFLVGGIIGWVVDLADGAAWEPAEPTETNVASTQSPYEPVCSYQEGDEDPGSPMQNEYLQVELTDGTILVLANVHRQSEGELPDGSFGVSESRIARKTWVVPADPDYAPRPPRACELASALQSK